MPTRALAMLVAGAAMLGGCSGLIDANVRNYGGLIAAAPLDPVVTMPALDRDEKPLVLNPFQPQASVDPTSYVVLEVADSLRKCKRLLDSQGIVSRGIDTDLDLVTTVLTALATAFTPVQTIHALTAAALISSGFKSTLDSDLYAKKTADIIATQIDTSYFAAMTDYIEKLAGRLQGKDNGSRPAIDPKVEFLRIALVHRQCNIDLALGALAEKAKVADVPADKDVFTLADLKRNQPLPGNLPGGPYIVVLPSDTYVLIRRASGGQPERVPTATLLKELNDSR